MFSKETYIQRRAQLKKLVGSGLVILLGNNDAPKNYPSNTYKFRQDSSFLYYIGLHRESLTAVIDIDNDHEYLLGNEIDIDDIVWFGYVPSIKEYAESVGIAHAAPSADLKKLVDAAKAKGQEIHFLPP